MSFDHPSFHSLDSGDVLLWGGDGFTGTPPETMLAAAGFGVGSYTMPRRRVALLRGDCMRLRVVGWVVQPLLMADDGENLTPVKVEPKQVPAAGWAAFKDGGDDAALAEIRAQIETETEEQADES